MSFNTAFKLSTAFSGVTLVAFSSIHGATARLAASSDIIREKSIKKSSTISFTKVKGDECVKFDTDISSNKEVIENYVDVGILACGGDLICLEDESSSTGARCVDSKEVLVKYACLPDGAWNCAVDSDCCGGHCEDKSEWEYRNRQCL
eukprot:scaffold29168_cov52-Cyclotella_meneghiniana.AAC.1